MAVRESIGSRVNSWRTAVARIRQRLHARGGSGRNSPGSRCRIPRPSFSSTRSERTAAGRSAAQAASRRIFETDILSSAEEALTLFKSRNKGYRALLTDVNLKGRLSGWDVARQIREEELPFPVVYMTGAAADDRAS